MPLCIFCLSLNAIVYLFSPVGGSRVHGGEVGDQVVLGETRGHPRGVEVPAGDQDFLFALCPHFQDAPSTNANPH